MAPFSPLSSSEKVGMGHVNKFNSLTTLDLTSLNNVTQLEGYFLSLCEALSNLALTPLSNVASIETCFLNGCKSLTTLDLTPLNNVTVIASSFLSGCNSFTTLEGYTQRTQKERI